MVDYNKPTVLQRNEPCPKTYCNQEKPHRKQIVMDIVDIEPLTRAFQENLSNHPAMLLSKDRSIERTGKRDVKRNISGVYTRAERK